MKITTYVLPVALLVLCAICAAIALVNGAGGIKKLLKGQRINRKTAVMSFLALLLAVGTLVPSVAMWPRSAGGESLTNAETGLGVTPDDPAVPMSGDRTNAQLDEFLKEGFGDDYESVWNGNTADEFMFPQDQAKILANEAYLKSLGLKDTTGFRNGVCFPTDILTADVIKDLSGMTDEERAEVFNQHRWLDIYRRIMTNAGFCDMVVQDLEEYPEYVEQNERWLPALKELLAEAKASPDGIYALLVKETDGTEHYSDAYRYGAAKVCASLENAVIRGVDMSPQSIMNWELPSLSPEVQDRWTVKTTEKDDKPATIWAFPNVKSGQDAYTDGFNLADLRVEKFVPEETNPGTPTTTPTDPETPTHKVTTYYRILNTETDIAQSTTQTVAEGKGWSTSAKSIDGYTYNSNNQGNSNQTVSGTMGKSNVTVIFYYTANPPTPRETYVNLTVLHEDADTGDLLRQEGPMSVVKGSQQTVHSQSFDGYTYAGYYTINNGGRINGSNATVDMDADKTITFYYQKEAKSYTVTAIYKVEGTNETLDTVTQTVKAGDRYSTTQKTFSGYTFSRTTGDSTSGIMPERNVTVIYWYTKNVQSYTVTTIHRAVDSNHELGRSTQTKKAGEYYTTSASSFTGYTYSHQTGDAASGTMPERNVTVTYWYKLVNEEKPGTKNPDSNPGNNGTGNATEGIGPGKGEEDHYIPSTIHDTDEQKGNEPTSNHRPTDNQGGQAAGSDQRQEVSDGAVSGIVGDNQETQSSGTGGQDPGHVDTGATEVEGGGYTPPAKDPIVPDTQPSGNDPVIGEGQELAAP